MAEGIIYWNTTPAIVFIVVLCIVSVSLPALIVYQITHSSVWSVIGSICGGVWCHKYLMKNMVRD